ncbi:MAG: PAS domain-containing protein [Candidatus Riflebacteria bacterium]|nr:PAS domain-containing protein [Candidatus Riflebacteria bacterium]
MPLTRKVIGTLLVAGFLVLLIVSGMRYHAGLLVLTGEYQHLLRSTTRHLGIALREPIFQHDLTTIRDALAAEFAQPQISAILVWLPHRDHLLLGLERAPDRRLVPTNDPRRGKPGLSLEAPILRIGANGESRLVGLVGVHLDPEAGRAQLRTRVLQDTLVDGLGFLLLITVVAWMLGESVAAPLDNLRTRLRIVEEAANQPETAETWPHLGSPAADPELAGAFRELRDMAASLGSVLETLWRRGESLRITLNSIGDAVIATDAQGVITRLNPVAEVMTGWPRHEAVGKPLTEVFTIVNGLTRAPADSPVAKVLASGEVVGLANHTILIGRHGKEYQIADSGAPIRDDHGQTVGVVLVFRDITEQHALESQLRQSRKMDAIGQLAGGIAHDFNNLLGGMMGSAELLAAKLPHDDPSRRYLDMIQQTGRTATELARKLLSFARQDRTEAVPVDLHQVLRDTGHLLEHSISRKISLRFDLGASRPLLLGNASDLQNLFLNLGLNARDAMPEGGTLSFTTRNLHLEPGEYIDGVFPVQPGDYLVAEVTDTGVGIPPELIERLFEPFFTTKVAGKGTGLGLSAVYGAVKRHQGSIRVSSLVGKGTTFQILLPQADPKVAAVITRSEVNPVQGTGLILVVEDDEHLRDTAKALLESLGYQVKLAANGVQGLAMFQEAPAEISALLVDLVMPEMDGRSLVLELRSRGFQVPIVVASGAAPPADLPKVLGPHGLFLPKPYSKVTLSQALATVLRPPPPASKT